MEFSPSYKPPQKYTGELIGVEYLYQQTGEVLQDFTVDPDSQAAAALEPTAEDEDDVDVETGPSLDSLFQDPTICLEELPPQRRSPVEPVVDVAPMDVQRSDEVTTDDTPALEPAQEDAEVHNTTEAPVALETAPTDYDNSVPLDNPQESVGPDNIPGYGHVEGLAAYSS
ncbi:uncharacterized protein [Ptychodera flava]|uniref:uncharacterized protein n=1 Tax=Ptychodera flava TaxID=63121 RepID=UPI00396A6067